MGDRKAAWLQDGGRPEAAWAGEAGRIIPTLHWLGNNLPLAHSLNLRYSLGRPNFAR